MIARPDAATSNGNVIYKIIGTLYNEVMDILAVVVILIADS
jgi:hypothetical protein